MGGGRTDRWMDEWSDGQTNRPWKLKLITEIKNTKWKPLRRGSGSWRVKSSNFRMKHDRDQPRGIAKSERELGLFCLEPWSHVVQTGLQSDIQLKMTLNL